MWFIKHANNYLTFAINTKLPFGSALFITGEDEKLGSWTLAHRMEYDSGLQRWLIPIDITLIGKKAKLLTGSYELGSQTKVINLMWYEGDNFAIPQPYFDHDPKPQKGIDLIWFQERLKAIKNSIGEGYLFFRYWNLMVMLRQLPHSIEVERFATELIIAFSLSSEFNTNIKHKLFFSSPTLIAAIRHLAPPKITCLFSVKDYLEKVFKIVGEEKADTLHGIFYEEIRKLRQYIESATPENIRFKFSEKIDISSRVEFPNNDSALLTFQK